jgi:hypothetical protein
LTLRQHICTIHRLLNKRANAGTQDALAAPFDKDADLRNWWYAEDGVSTR